MSAMREKIDHLRRVAADLLNRAEATTNPGEAKRLIMLAARIQEQIFELEEQMKAGGNGDPNNTS